jgi:hypothetical protein
MAEDVEAFMAEKKIEQPVLIGHSMFVAAFQSNSDSWLIQIESPGGQKSP